MVETNEKTGSSFMVRVVPSNESKEVKSELLKLLYVTCTRLPDGRARGDVPNLYPFRKKVVLNQDKLLESKEASEILSSNKRYNYVGQLAVKLKIAYKNNSFLKIFGVSGLDHGDSKFSDAVEVVFKEHDNVIKWDFKGETIDISYEDYIEFKRLRSLVINYNHFCRLLHDVGSDTYIPVQFITENYIKFDRGYSLVSFRLDSSSEKRTMLETVLFRNMQSLLTNTSAEIVNYSLARSFSIFDILCKNEDVTGVMNLFSKVFEEFEDSAIDKNYNLDFGIKRNIGQEDCTEERYYLLSGEYYNDLKSKFKFKDEKYLDLDLYYL